MDDARVTAGFARRMEATLPRALGAVNASVALKFVEAGRIGWAKRHAEFLENGETGNLERTVEAVLSPVKNRIRHFVENAEKTTTRDAKQGNNAAIQLIEQVRPQLFLFDLFKGQQAHRNDFLDQVATVCVNCLVSYVKATDDDDSFVASLRATQTIAHSEDVKARIQRNIDAGEEALTRKTFAPIRKELEGIKAPASKLSFVHKELMPRLADLIRRQGDCASARQFADGIAEILRAISLDAYNEHDDLETAEAASLLALKICKNPALKSRLVEDHGQLRKFSDAEKQHDLHSRNPEGRN